MNCINCNVESLLKSLEECAESPSDVILMKNANDRLPCVDSVVDLACDLDRNIDFGIDLDLELNQKVDIDFEPNDLFDGVHESPCCLN